MPRANPNRPGGPKKAGNPEAPAQVGWIYAEILTGVLPLPGGLILGRFIHVRGNHRKYAPFCHKAFCGSQLCPIVSYGN
jgi:hypothetical protein